MTEIRINNILKISTNKIYSSQSWHKRQDAKDQYLELTKDQFSKLTPITKLVDLHFTFCFTKNAFDSSNCSYMAKMIEDCLVEYGVLRGDGIKHVGRVSFKSTKNKNKEEDYCILEILT
tara:strand:- start:14 stop:370 length:357 start_codon:yes stop_codon:yes gene_type:complete